MPKYMTRKVTKFAFVMPVYDYDITPHKGGVQDVMIPCEDRHMVGYNVYGWNYKNQSWKGIGIGDYYDEAKEIADTYDKKMVKKLGVYCDDMGNKKSYDER